MEESAPLAAGVGRGLLAEIILQFERRTLTVDAACERSDIMFRKRKEPTMTTPETTTSGEHEAHTDTSGTTSSSDLWCEAMMVDEFSFSDSSFHSANILPDVEEDNFLDDHFALLERAIEQACELTKLSLGEDHEGRLSDKPKVFSMMDTKTKVNGKGVPCVPQSHNTVRPLNYMHHKMNNLRAPNHVSGPIYISDDDYDGDCELEEVGQRNSEDNEDMDSDDL